MTLHYRTPPRLVLFLALAAVSLMAVVYSRNSPAAPTFTWTPSSLTAEVGAGQSSSTSATFTASENAANVTIEVVPELAPYVTVSPSTFASIAKGGSYTLRVAFAPSATATLGTYDGTIHVRQGAKTLAKPLPVQLRVVWPTLDASEALGIKIAYPPGWYAQSTKTTVSFRNVDYLPSTRDDTYAFFQVVRLTNVNPSGLPILEWFDTYFSLGFSSGPASKKFLMVGGRDAVRIEILGVGTDANIYIPDKTDVIEVVYGLDTPYFIADYEAMLQSLSFTE